MDDERPLRRLDADLGKGAQVEAARYDPSLRHELVQLRVLDDEEVHIVTQVREVVAMGLLREERLVPVTEGVVGVDRRMQRRSSDVEIGAAIDDLLPAQLQERKVETVHVLVLAPARDPRAGEEGRHPQVEDVVVLRERLPERLGLDLEPMAAPKRNQPPRGVPEGMSFSVLEQL